MTPLLILMLSGAAPPGQPTPEQAVLLTRIKALHAGAAKHLIARDLPEAAKAVLAALRLEVELEGETSAQVAGSFRALGRLLRIAGQEGSAATAWRQEEAAWRRLLGPGNWREADAARKAREAESPLPPALKEKEARAETRNREGKRLHEAGDYVKAARAFREAATLFAAARDERCLHHAAALNNLGLALKKADDLGQAEGPLRRALAIREGALGRSHPAVAESLGNLALWHAARGEPHAGLAASRRALAILRETRGAWSLQYGMALNDLATLYEDLGRLAEAIDLHREALAVIVAATGERDPVAISALNNVAHSLGQVGHYREAAAMYRRALALRRAALGPKHPDVAVSLNNLAAAMIEGGNRRGAVPLLREAVAVLAASVGERHHLYAVALRTLSSALAETADYREALLLSRRGVEVTRAALGERHPDYALAVSNTAVLLQESGDLEGALPETRRALALTQAAYGRRHQSTAQQMYNLAGLLVALRRPGEAKPLLEEAAAVFAATAGKKHPRYASALNALGLVASNADDDEAALRLYGEALAMKREALGQTHHGLAEILSNVGVSYHNLGRFEDARGSYTHALELVPPETRGNTRATVLSNLTAVYQATRRPGPAVLTIEEALRRSSEAANIAAAVQSERQQLAALVRIGQYIDARLSLPDDEGPHPYRHVLAWKGAAFRLAQDRRLFTSLGSAGPEAAEAAARLREAAAGLSALASAPVGREGQEARRQRLAALSAEVERQEAVLSRLSVAYREAGDTRRITPEGLAAALPEGVVLVDYLFYTRKDFTRPEGAGRHVRRLTAFVLKRGAAPTRVELGEQAPVKEAVQAWRRMLEDGRDGGLAPARLKALVWTPLAKHLAGAGTVLVSPDGLLSGVPFCALPGEKPGSHLLEETRLSIIPQPQALPALLRPAAGRAGLLTVGAVDFGEGGGWAALPATRPEVEAAAARYKAGPVTALAGEKATKAAVRAALVKARHAHLATHGFYAPEKMRDALGRPDVPPGERGLGGWHPGLLCGLVFAGANRPDADGSLAGVEIAELDLSGMELAVLSACQSSLGALTRGEGLQGLQRAFAVAGCRSVVSSLWSVDDAATSVLMERFYLHLWEKKLSKAEALRQAQIDVLRDPGLVEARAKDLAGVKGVRGTGRASEVIVSGRKERRSPPAWWAAWQLSGDWR